MAAVAPVAILSLSIGSVVAEPSCPETGGSEMLRVSSAMTLLMARFVVMPADLRPEM